MCFSCDFSEKNHGVQQFGNLRPEYSAAYYSGTSMGLKCLTIFEELGLGS